MALETKIKIGLALIIGVFLMRACWFDKKNKISNEDKILFNEALKIKIINEEIDGKSIKYHLLVDTSVIADKMHLNIMAEEFVKKNCKDYCTLLFYNRYLSNRSDSCIGMYLSIDSTFIVYTDKLKD